VSVTQTIGSSQERGRKRLVRMVRSHGFAGCLAYISRIMRTRTLKSTLSVVLFSSSSDLF